MGGGAGSRSAGARRCKWGGRAKLLPVSFEATPRRLEAASCRNRHYVSQLRQKGGSRVASSRSAARARFRDTPVGQWSHGGSQRRAPVAACKRCTRAWLTRASVLLAASRGPTCPTGRRVPERPGPNRRQARDSEPEGARRQRATPTRAGADARQAGVSRYHLGRHHARGRKRQAAPQAGRRPERTPAATAECQWLKRRTEAQKRRTLHGHTKRWRKRRRLHKHLRNRRTRSQHVRRWLRLSSRRGPLRKRRRHGHHSRRLRKRRSPQRRLRKRRKTLKADRAESAARAATAGRPALAGAMSPALNCHVGQVSHRVNALGTQAANRAQVARNGPRRRVRHV